MNKKLILFDWGNIVESHTTGYSCYDAWDDLFKACGYSINNVRVADLIDDYNLSCIPTINEFKLTYSKIAKDFNLKTTYLDFVDLYKRIFDNIDYYKNVSEYEKSLKDRCSIGILSNLTILDKERLDKQVDLSKYDYAFLSFEMRCRKPDKEIYNKVNEKIPFNHENILFIDDNQVNINTAKEYGWQTLRATGLELEKIKKCCEGFLHM